MSDFLRLRPNDDDDVRRGLRALYAAPDGEEYWRGLEARILSRLVDMPSGTLGWWDELDRWMRPALVAAAIVLLAAGVSLVREYQTEQQVAYEAMLTPTPAALPVETAVRPVLQEQRETTFRYLMTP